MEVAGASLSDHLFSLRRVTQCGEGAEQSLGGRHERGRPISGQGREPLAEKAPEAFSGGSVGCYFGAG